MTTGLKPIALTGIRHGKTQTAHQAHTQLEQDAGAQPTLTDPVTPIAKMAQDHTQQPKAKPIPGDQPNMTQKQAATRKTILMDHLHGAMTEQSTGRTNTGKHPHTVLMKLPDAGPKSTQMVHNQLGARMDQVHGQMLMETKNPGRLPT